MKGVIYDLDGVLVNTAKYHYMSWKKLADELGVPFDEVKNEKLKGVSRRDSLIAMLGRVPEEKRVSEWCNLKNKYYLEFIKTIDRKELLPGALDMIDEVKRTPGWTQALASSSKNAKMILEKLDIDKYFKTVIDGHSTERTKPDPELFLLAAKGIGLTPNEVVVCEDAESGVQAAKAGKFRAIGIGDPAILHQADLVVKDLAQIKLADIDKLFQKKPK